MLDLEGGKGCPKKADLEECALVSCSSRLVLCFVVGGIIKFETVSLFCRPILMF